MDMNMYIKKITRELKRMGITKVNHSDPAIKDFIQTGFRLGSFPYYPANQIANMLEEKAAHHVRRIDR
jgi:hypothetical protein